MSDQVVLWNAKEAQARCEVFVQSLSDMRSDLLDHYNHKGHCALRYSDDWPGFFAYCKERLKLESNEQTIRLQIATAQVSREVGVEVPMVIARQIGKLPREQQKEVYDEVIGAREKAGQRSANQMEPDARRVVRRIMGIEEKPPKPPVSTTDTEPSSVSLHNQGVDAHYREMGIPTPAEQMAALAPIDPEVAEKFVSGPFTEPLNYREAYSEARALLCRFAKAYMVNNQNDLIELCHKAREFLALYREP